MAPEATPVCPAVAGLRALTVGLAGFAPITAVPIPFAGFCCMVLSAGGTGLRLLVGRFASR